MRRAAWLLFVLVIVVAGTSWSGTGYAQVSVGVQTPGVQLGIQIGPTPPPLVIVPQPVVVTPGPPPPPVYYAPSVAYNYFVYQNVHYVYNEGRWFRGRHHNGPWTAIAIAQVPRPILAVPIEHYHARPAHWKQHGPPPWKYEREREREWRHDRGRGHDKNHGHGGGRGHNKD